MCTNNQNTPVMDTVFSRNPKHSPLPASRKKFNSTIAKISPKRTALLSPDVCDLTVYCKGAEKQNRCRYLQGRSSVFGMANSPETEGICPLQKHQLLPSLHSNLWKERSSRFPVPHHTKFRHGQPPSPHPQGRKIQFCVSWIMNTHTVTGIGQACSNRKFVNDSSR